MKLTMTGNTEQLCGPQTDLQVWGRSQHLHTEGGLWYHARAGPRRELQGAGLSVYLHCTVGGSHHVLILPSRATVMKIHAPYKMGVAVGRGSICTESFWTVSRREPLGTPPGECILPSQNLSRIPCRLFSMWVYILKPILVLLQWVSESV